MEPRNRDSLSDSNGAVELRPGKLWSLGDIMKDFSGSGLLSLSYVCGVWTLQTSRENELLILTRRQENIDALASHTPILTDLGLSASLASVRKMIALLKNSNAKWAELHSL